MPILLWQKIKYINKNISNTILRPTYIIGEGDHHKRIDYFLDCIKLNGSLKGSYIGVKRLLRCHPIKFLGGRSGFDPVPNLKKGKK